MDSKDCGAKITVRLTPDEDGVKLEQDLELVCCLIGPHPGFKHMNPRVQRTVGGERRTESKEWSYYLEKSTPISSKQIDEFKKRYRERKR